MVLNVFYVDYRLVHGYHLICLSDYSMVFHSLVFMLTIVFYMVFPTLALIYCNSWVFCFYGLLTLKLV